MPSDASYIEIVKGILESPELASGSHLIARVNLDVDTFTGAAYHLRTGGLLSAQHELLVLFSGPPTPSDFDTTAALVKRYGVETNLICVAPEGKNDGSIASLGSHGIVIWDPVRLFDHLVVVPGHFQSLLQTVARVQRPDEFESTFQEREAHVYGKQHEPPRRVDLGDHLREWLAARRRMRPVMLLGERGTGKSWQLLRFAEKAYGWNREDPWQNGLAIFVRLSELVNLIDQASAATPVLLHYILTKYAALRFPFGGASFLGALIRAGHCVVCVDGFDEMDMLPTDAEVRARLTGLLLLLSKSTRFVLSCRPGHFESLSSIFGASAWGATSIAQTFEILELAPFDRSRKLGYIEAATRQVTDTEAIERLAGLVGESPDPLQRALSTCARHPGFLAHMAATANVRKTTACDLIGSGIEKVFIDYNLVHARTARSYHTQEGKRVNLSVGQRMGLLADIAWYMAERQLSYIDLANLPPRIKLWYEIEDDALERDLRSQTVFELVPLGSEPHPRGAGTEPESGDIPWADSLENSLAAGQALKASRVSLARFTLRTDEEELPYEKRSADVGESSVCGGYFLAQYIAARLLETGPFGSLQGEDRLGFLGRVKLGPQTAAILREMLSTHNGRYLAELGTQSWRLMRRRAVQGRLRIYSAWFRHLAANLAAIGALSWADADAMDPWSSAVRPIVVSPTHLREYEMVLVTPPVSASDDEAFLLGVHEVTNEQYLKFLRSGANADSDSTVQGRAWSVNCMTIAGSGLKTPPSRNRPLSNEYHLFHWLPYKSRTSNATEKSGDSPLLMYLPPPEILGHPVSYVSWYAAAAYCDWLSTGKQFPRYYIDVLRAALDPSIDLATVKTAGPGYRLPKVNEWIWAAKSGHDELSQPWNLFPFYLPSETKEVIPGPEGTISCEVAWENFKKAQKLMRAILQDSGKAHSDVLNDEPNEFGVSGLIGNVREWCHYDDEARDDSPGRLASIAASEQYILGATGYLGEATFSFTYATPLFRRNTNPDVGFRVARSLGEEEFRILREREAEIADLPEIPPGRA